MDEIKVMYEELDVYLEQSTDLFYQQKYKEGFETVNVFLLKLSNFIDYVSLSQHADIPILINEEELNLILLEIMVALEKKDTVLLSDLLRYELKEYLQNRVMTN